MRTPGPNDRQALRGWSGLSPGYWAVALELQEKRLVDSHRALIEAPRDSDEHSAAFRQLHIDAHFLLISLRHILRALDVCAQVLDDGWIKAISDDVAARAPWLKDFRDALEHLDAYMRGEGRLHRQGKLPPGARPFIAFDPLAPPLEVFAHLGANRLPLRAAARGGSRLGQLLAEAWEQRFGPEKPHIVWGRGQ